MKFRCSNQAPGRDLKNEAAQLMKLHLFYCLQCRLVFQYTISKHTFRVDYVIFVFNVSRTFFV